MRNSAPATIGLNLLHARPSIGGGWNYIESLIEGIARYDQANRYIAFTNLHTTKIIPKQSNFKTIQAPLPSVLTNQFARVAYENSFFLTQLQKYNVQLVHWFGNTVSLIPSVPSCVTIHDLKAFHSWSSYPMLKKAYLQRAIRYTAKTAAMLLPVSSFTQHELQTLLNVPPERTQVLPVIIDKMFEPANADKVDDFKQRHALPSQFWLYVAHTYPHKNHANLLHAYARLRDANPATPKLVLRGDRKGAEDQVQQLIMTLNLNEHVIRLPRLMVDEMPTLYSAAMALVFPSTFEGGGIPVVEAIACGCPVLASALPVIKEFAGESVTYFDVNDGDSLLQAMVEFEIQKDERKLAEKRTLGLARAAMFSAEHVTGNLLAAYDKVLTS